MRRQATGFTLIEVLVVLVIMGVMATVVSIGVGSLNERSDERSLQRLSRAIEAAAERAMVRGRPLAVEFGAGGCRFLVMNIDGSWQAMSEPPLFAEWHLPSGWTWASLRHEGAPAIHS
jgi:general secretion pathway protein H